MPYFDLICIFYYTNTHNCGNVIGFLVSNWNFTYFQSFFFFYFCLARFHFVCMGLICIFDMIGCIYRFQPNLDIYRSVQLCYGKCGEWFGKHRHRHNYNYSRIDSTILPNSEIMHFRICEYSIWLSARHSLWYIMVQS